MPLDHAETFGRARARAPRASRTPMLWKSGGAVALFCSTIAWASLPRPVVVAPDQPLQWQALRLAPLSIGGATGMVMAPTAAVASVSFVPKRAVLRRPPASTQLPPVAAPLPLRIRGKVGDGFYWSLRAAGASPQVAAQYLAALATTIDVGDVGPSDTFDLVLGADRQLLYAGLNRAGLGGLQLVKWSSAGRSEWVNAADASKPAASTSGMAMPASGPITSYFGYRYHPILHFTRFHAGIDIGAGWGTPIVAAGDGEVIGAGWSGGYGREVQIAHGGGVVSLYGHMSEIVAQPGSRVRQGQVIGYVGSSGLSTGPHLHFEVRQGGQPVNPLAVHFTAAPIIASQFASAVKERLRTLLSVGLKRS